MPKDLILFDDIESEIHSRDRLTIEELRGAMAALEACERSPKTKKHCWHGWSRGEDLGSQRCCWCSNRRFTAHIPSDEHGPYG